MELGDIYAENDNVEKSIFEYERSLAITPDYYYTYNRLGLAYMIDGSYDKALEYYTKGTSQPSPPDMTTAFIGLGNANFVLKHYDQSIKNYSQAISLNSGDPIGYYKRSQAYKAKRDDQRAQADLKSMAVVDPIFSAIAYRMNLQVSDDSVISAYDRFIRQHPNDPLVLLGRGEAYARRFKFGPANMVRDDYRSAIVDLDNTIKLEPKFAEAFNARAQLELSNDYDDEAIADFGNAIAIRPSYADAYFGRGEAYAAAGDYGLAVSDFDKVTTLAPDAAQAYYQHGLADEAMEQPDKAITNYTDAIRLSQNSATGVDLETAYQSRGMAYYAKQDYAAAVADFTRSIAQNKALNDLTVQGMEEAVAHGMEFDSGFADKFYRRGLAYSHEQDYFHAIADYTDAIKLSATVPAEYYDSRADAFNGIGSKDNAVADYNRAGAVYGEHDDFSRSIIEYDKSISLQTSNPVALNGRCWSTAASGGDIDQALLDCNQSLKLVPDDAFTLDSRGFVFLRLEQADAAIADYTAALKHNPKLASSLYGRGLAENEKSDGTGDADLSAAESIDSNIIKEFAVYGM
jgi:tetratricopeptide (TPR) repeat protein